MLKYQMPWPTGGTVDVYLASDAESAIREANNYWSTFWEKECTARVAEARKQGADEGAKREREKVLCELQQFRNSGPDVQDSTYVVLNAAIKHLKARGAAESCKCYSPGHPDNCMCGCHNQKQAEPVCTCAWVGDHHPDCPCYKPPEPVCDCWRHEHQVCDICQGVKPPEPVCTCGGTYYAQPQVHRENCPCYKPVESHCDCAYPHTVTHASWCKSRTPSKPPEPPPLEKFVFGETCEAREYETRSKINSLIDAIDSIGAEIAKLRGRP